MVLIADDNKYRSEKIAKCLRDDGFFAFDCIKEYADCYAKPLITVIVDPTAQEMSLVNRKYDDTVYVFCAKYKKPYMMPYKYLFIDSEINVTADDIKKILSDEFNYSLVCDDVGMFVADREEKCLYMGGKDLMLTHTEYDIASFFVYNYGKNFSSDELFGYLGYNGKKAPDTLANHISSINSKTRRIRGEKLIVSTTTGYSLNPDLTEKILNIMSK